jgi:sugar O-acyltransferase (sialic acid O-acetyltransferase NeuD family)
MTTIITRKEIRDIILWGASGQARVLREFVETGERKIIAVFDNNREVDPPFPDIPLFYGRDGFESWLGEQRGRKRLGCLAAIGGSRGRDRSVIQAYLESFGIVSPVVVHPRAFVARDAVIGDGSQILSQCAVCAGTTLGRSCIVNTGATVDHECRLGDGVHIGPGAHLASSVVVEDFATVFSGGVVIPGILIGRHAIVGAGAVVTRNVTPFSVVAGNPARVIKTVQEDDSSWKEFL